MEKVVDLEEILAEARAASLSRDNPLLSDLPGWFVGLRDHQRVAIREILTAYEEGAECVVLDAPTGSGKTLIGETVRRLLAGTNGGSGSGTSYHTGRSTTYICSSKALQDQFVRDYPYARVLKGRSNYATESYPERFTAKDPLSAADCTKTPGDPESCLWCSSTRRCPYELAKSDALRASLAVLNTSYFLSECNGPGRFSRGGLVIADECLAAGTQISTPNGLRNIEDIRTGDVIWGEKGGKVVRTTVEATSINEAPVMTLNGLWITGNHPILTARGYVEASQINSLDRIAVTGLNPSHGASMRMVPTALPGEEPEIFQRKVAQVLQQGLLRGVEENVAEDSAFRELRVLREGIQQYPKTTEVLQPALRQSMELGCQSGKNEWGFEEVARGSGFTGSTGQITGLAERPKQPDLRSSSPVESYTNSDGTRLRPSRWWQRSRANRTSTNSSQGVGSRVDNRVSGINGSADDSLLRYRYSSSASVIGDRSGRKRSSGGRANSTRPTQNSLSGKRRVGGYSSPESRSVPGTSGSVTVYNLRTTTHNYIANGIIVHNCDSIESELMGHVEVRVSEGRLKTYGLSTPKYVTKEESWREWAEEAYEKVRARPPIRRNTSGDQVQAIREAKRHDYLVEKLRTLKLGLDSGGWIYVGSREAAAFKPVTVDKLGQEKLWSHGDKWLLMSATVISADEMLESLGWADDKEWRLVKCPSTFAPENRKVIVWPVASMTYKERDESIPKLVEAVKEIVAKHPDDRVLVHSTSYALTNDIVKGLSFACGSSVSGNLPPRPLLTYSQSSDKDSILAQYLSLPAAILVAPSMDRGIDLPGDKCRVQIICKVPFLSLKDKQVSARLYGTGRSGKVWYAVNALRTIIQSCGRAVRSEEDWAVTYILDSQFVSNLYGGYRNLVPAWWKESLVWKKGA